MIKAELLYEGRHDGMGTPCKAGSYAKITIVERGDAFDEPQKLTFLVPCHQVPQIEPHGDRLPTDTEGEG